MTRPKVITLTASEKRKVWAQVAQSLSRANKALCKARDTFNYHEPGYAAMNAAVETHEAAWRIAAGHMPLMKENLGCGSVRRGVVLLGPIASAD